MDTLKKIICDEVDKIKNDVLKLSQNIYENPELAFQEFKASEWIIEMLMEHNFKIKRPIGNLETAFQASYKGKGDGPKIAFLAEYDALEGLGHGCGHNIIASSAVGAAIALSKVITDLDGEVIVIGTPAEEYGGGKILLVEDGVFDKVDYALMIHPAAVSLVGRGGLACTTIELEFHGKSTHSSGPDRGVNALQAIIAVFNGIDSLRSCLKDQTRLNGIITDGGKASNVIPDYARATFTIRAKTADYLKQVLEKIKDIIKGAELLTGAKSNVKIGLIYEERYPNMVMAETFKNNMKLLGEEMRYPLPDERIGSSDIGNVSIKIPTIHPYINITETIVGNHTYEFLEAANSKKAKDMTIKATKGLALTGYEILINEILRQEIQEEFKAKVKK